MEDTELERRVKEVRKEISEEPEWLKAMSQFQGGGLSYYRDDHDDEPCEPSDAP